MTEIKKMIKWIDKNDRLPAYGKRVLTYSPEYDNKHNKQKNDNVMMFRIMDSQFVEISIDVKYWAYIEKPE